MHSIRIGEGVTAERSGDRLVVLDAAGSAMSTLNPTGAIIWTILADADPSGLSNDELVAAARSRFGTVDPDELANDIGAFVRDLVDLGLLSLGT